MPKTGQLVVGRFRTGRCGRINFQPGATQRQNICGRILAVIPEVFRAQNALILCRQRGGVHRRQTDVFYGDVHQPIKKENASFERKKEVARPQGRPSVAQTFLSAGSRDIPVPSFELACAGI